MGVGWVGSDSLCMPSLLPLHCAPTPQVDVCSNFFLSWRRHFGRIHASFPCFCPLVTCHCALPLLYLTPHYVCCRCVQFGAFIHSNLFARALSVVSALLIVWLAVCCQVVLCGAVLYSNLALSTFGVFLILPPVWQVLYASMIVAISFIIPVRAVCPVCIAFAFVLLLYVSSLFRLLFTWLSPSTIQMLVILQHIMILVLFYLYHLLR